jgi:type I restriction enzyme, S subunit
MNAPATWATASLGESCLVITDGTHHSPANGPVGEFKYITAKNIKRNGLDLSNVTYIDAHTHAEIYRRCPAKKGDILYIKDGATTGIAVLNPLDESFSLLSSVALIRPDPRLLSETYLCRLLNSPEIFRQMTGDMTGSAIRRLTLTTIGRQMIPLPPVPEQRRIAAKIDSLSANSKRARDHLDHIPRLVAKYKQGVLAAAFRGELTRDWRKQAGRHFDWENTTLGRQLVDIRYGTSKKCNYDGGAVGVLRIPNVQLGKIQIDDLKSADFTSDELRKLRLEKGDILIIRSNGSLDLVGRSAVVDDAAVGMLFAGYLIRIRLNTNLAIPEYVQLYLQATAVRELVERLAKSTSGVNNVNSTQLQQLPFSRPSTDEQREIVRVIGIAFSWIDRLHAETTSARKLVDHLDQAILAKAFRGELVPQDPNDEPASVLLGRIKAGRQATPILRSRSEIEKVPEKTIKLKPIGRRRRS